MHKILTKVAMAAVAVVGVSTSAQAYVFMRLADLNPVDATIQTQVVCRTDMAQNNAAGGNCSTTDGFAGYSLGTNTILFLGSVGNWNVSTTSGVANVPGTPIAATLDSSSTSVVNKSVAFDSFYIDFRGFDFLFPAGEDKTLFGTASHSTSTVVAGAPATVNTFFYADPMNGGGTTVADSCSMVLSTNASCNSGAPIVWSDVGLGTFSLRSQQFFNVNGGQVINSTATVTVGAIPEPMTLSLVGAALLGAGLVSRRRAKKA